VGLWKVKEMRKEEERTKRRNGKHTHHFLAQIDATDYPIRYCINGCHTM